jgi:MFS family permease
MTDFDRNTTSHLNQNRPSSLNQLYEDAIVASNLNGKYQKILFFILAIVAFSSSMIVTGFPSQKEIPPYVCVNRLDFEESITEYKEYKNNPLRYKIIHQEECVAHYCSMEENFESPIFWVLIADYKKIRNFVTHLDLMCDIESYSGDFTRWIFMGRIVTTVLFSYVSDTYGRRTSWLIVLCLLALSNFLFLTISNKSLYHVIGFLSNMCMSNYNLTMIISVEVMNSDLYSIFNGVVAMLFAFCGIFTIIIMSYFKDWLVLVFIHLVIDISMIYMSYYYFYETPYFCLNKRKYDDLNDVIVNISKVNGTYEHLVKGKLEKIEHLKRSLGVVYRKVITNTSPNSPEMQKGKRKLTAQSNLSELSNFSLGEHDNQGHNEQNSQSIFVALFKPYINIFYKRRQLLNLIKLTLPFITINFVYYGQLMFLERLPGDPKTNSFLIFFSELIAPNLAGWLMQFTGRKKILYFFHVCCIIFCLALAHVNNEFASTILLFLNSFSIAFSFVVSYVFAAEVFPTSIKTSANGLLILIGNFSLVIGDLLMSIFPSPFYLFALICLGSIFSISTMKETYKEKSEK